MTRSPVLCVQICKIFSGLTTEIFTDADTFEVKCPTGAPADTKVFTLPCTMHLLVACHLLVHLIFSWFRARSPLWHAIAARAN